MGYLYKIFIFSLDIWKVFGYNISWLSYEYAKEPRSQMLRDVNILKEVSVNEENISAQEKTEKQRTRL